MDEGTGNTNRRLTDANTLVMVAQAVVLGDFFHTGAVPDELLSSELWEQSVSRCSHEDAWWLVSLSNMLKTKCTGRNRRLARHLVLVLGHENFSDLLKVAVPCPIERQCIFGLPVHRQNAPAYDACDTIHVLAPTDPVFP